MKRVLLFLSVAAAAGAVIGCREAIKPQLNLVGPVADLRVVFGDSQTGTVHAALDSAIAVRATDAKAQVAPGQLINFVVVSGGGHVFAGVALTDTAGMARERWTLGDTAGVQRLEARAVDPQTGAPIVYARIVATAKPGPLVRAGFAARLLRVFGAARVALPGLAADAYGNAVPLPAVTALDSLTPDAMLAITPDRPGLFRFILALDTLRLLVYVPGGKFRAVMRRADTTWTETGTLGFRSFDQITLASTVDTLASYLLAGLILTRQIGANRPDSMLVGSLNAPSLQHQIFLWPTPSSTTVKYWCYRWPGLSIGITSVALASGGRWTFSSSTVDSLTITP